MESLGLLGVVGLLFVKEAGLPLPVPGDLVVLGTGVAAARGDIPAVPALIVIVIAGIAGGLVQFALVRTVARDAFLGLVARLGVGPRRTAALSTRLQSGGSRAVAVSRMTPGVRVAAIAAAGLAGIGYRPFAVGLIAGNTVFVGGHFLLGYAAGERALQLAGGAGLSVVLIVAVLAVFGAAGWFAISRSRARRVSRVAQARAETIPEATVATVPDTTGSPVSKAAPEDDETATAASWTDAACPACLLLAALDRQTA